VVGDLANALHESSAMDMGGHARTGAECRHPIWLLR
jgi:hypothetical protein